LYCAFRPQQLFGKDPREVKNAEEKAEEQKSTLEIENYEIT